MTPRACTSLWIAILLWILPTFASVARADDPESLVWVDADELQVEGRAFEGRERTWDRLPARARDLVRPPVWELSRQSAGIVVRFRTDSPTVAVRWTLSSDRRAMPHMPATGVSGVDLYTRVDGEWRWVACGSPGGLRNERVLVEGLEPIARDWMLYLPLYNGVERVSIGVASGYEADPLPPRSEPIVFYGTSITQGACASRPGMNHVAILGRRLDRPVVNLGFSGNGRLEPEVGRFLVEIDASVIVLDCLPNLDAETVSARTVPMVELIRRAHPKVPIVLVEGRAYADAGFDEGRRRRNTENWRALRACFQELRDRGFEGIHYLEGDRLLGDDGEATVDGSHPTDLGFMRQADAFEPVLRRAIVEGKG
ncbi:MAG: SGNH/GDSL hydrolase family protein [Planctomycetota bacterium]|nr:SGNH/GDSL hydrolase family protein [Planctomycetota bacterium]